MLGHLFEEVIFWITCEQSIHTDLTGFALFDKSETIDKIVLVKNVENDI